MVRIGCHCWIDYLPYDFRRTIADDRTASVFLPDRNSSLVLNASVA